MDHPITGHLTQADMLNVSNRSMATLDKLAKILVEGGHTGVQSIITRAELSRVSGIDSSNLGKYLDKPGFVKVYTEKRLRGVYFLPSFYDTSVGEGHYPRNVRSLVPVPNDANWLKFIILPKTVDDRLREAKKDTSRVTLLPLTELRGMDDATLVPFKAGVAPASPASLLIQIEQTLNYGNLTTTQKYASVVSLTLSALVAQLNEEEVR